MTLAIKVENLSKAYQIGQIGTGTISRDLERWWTTRILRKEDPFVRLGVATSITSGYLTLLALDARLSVVRETFDLRRKELHVEQRRFEAGYSSRLELTQAQAELAATE